MNNDNPNQSSQPTDSNNDSGQSLTDLVDVLQSVDTESPEASLNATSIDDNVDMDTKILTDILHDPFYYGILVQAKQTVDL